MNKALIFSFAFVVLSACQNSGATKVNSSSTAAAKTTEASTSLKSSGAPVMSFDKTSHDFGTINEGDKVKIYTPYLNGDKFDILKDGESCCECLGVDFDEVYKRTNTSYKPIKHYYRPETNAFKWYSDYKSASSVERIESFIKLGRPDPVEYANEKGPVDYEVAKAHVEQVLAEH